MERESYAPQIEQEKSRGHNIDIRIIFVRHAQKADARVFNKELTEISSASISPKGAELAYEKGRDLKGPKKGYVTSVTRTNETLQEMLKGSGITDPDELERMSQDYLGFPGIHLGSATPSFTEYNRITEEAKKKYLNEHFPGKSYDDLTLDEQEQVMEIAEEPALQWYLNHKEQRPDPETYSPKEMAGLVAYKLNRFVNLPEYMEDGKEVELISVGHKTSTEAFLKYMIGFEDLSEMGGSLRTLDNWEFDVKTDAVGNKTVELRFRDKVYPLDRDKLSELAQVGRELLEQEEKKIDRRA